MSQQMPTETEENHGESQGG